MLIRTATLDDASVLRDLIGQLGYSADPQVVARSLDKYLTSPETAVFVAEDAGRVIGMASGCELRLLGKENVIELLVLVVDEKTRSRGAGHALLVAFEAWARGRGAKSIRLASRDWRVDAHRFYDREGYQLEKVQHIFRKELA